MQDAHVPPLCNCLALRQAARQATQFYDRHLAPTGLRTSQFAILATLARRGPLSVGQLAGAMVMDRTTVGRAVRPLEREGLAEVGAGRDARTRALKLTDAGRRRLDEALPLWRTAQGAFEERYGAPDSAALRTALSRVVTAL